MEENTYFELMEEGASSPLAWVVLETKVFSFCHMIPPSILTLAACFEYPLRDPYFEPSMVTMTVINGDETTTTVQIQTGKRSRFKMKGRWSARNRNESPNEGMALLDLAPPLSSTSHCNLNGRSQWESQWGSEWKISMGIWMEDLNGRTLGIFRKLVFQVFEGFSYQWHNSIYFRYLVFSEKVWKD